MSRELIEALGGSKQVSLDLHRSHGSVRNWMLDGRSIPWRFRPAIAKIAAERGVSLPEDFWQVPAAPDQAEAA